MREMVLTFILRRLGGAGNGTAHSPGARAGLLGLLGRALQRRRAENFGAIVSAAGKAD